MVQLRVVSCPNLMVSFHLQKVPMLLVWSISPYHSPEKLTDFAYTVSDSGFGNVVTLASRLNLIFMYFQRVG